MKHETDTKKFAAGLSVLVNAVIIVMKMTAGYVCSSISVFSEGIHSLGDLFASAITFFSVSKSTEPADKKHPFGHGKYEDMSGFIEGAIIILASIFIVIEAIKKIINPSAEEFDVTIGLYVMGISCVLDIIVSSILLNTAKKTDSTALYADAQHLRTDIYSSLGVFVGLALIELTGLRILDSVIAILVAIIIFKTGYEITQKTSDKLLDSSIPDSEIEIINEILNSFKNKGVVEYNNLKTRKLGSQISLEVTLIFPKNMTILECHDICDLVEKNLKEKLGNVESSIHLEPNLSCSVSKK